jgi:hypothetical protein
LEIALKGHTYGEFLDGMDGTLAEDFHHPHFLFSILVARDFHISSTE